MRIAINGVGVAGPALAYWLLRGGHEVTLVEESPVLRTGGYVIDFWGLGYSVAERMDILDALRAAGYRVGEVRFVDGRGERTSGFTTDALRASLGERFTSLPRGALAEIAYRAVEARVETIFGDSMRAIEDRDDAVGVAFEKHAAREFDLVIGADGLHSRVRELVFGAGNRFERRLGCHVAAFEAEGYRPRDELAYVIHSRPGRQVSRLALRGDRTMFLFVFGDEHMEGPEPRDDAQRRAVLKRVFGDMGWECPRILHAMESAGDVYFDQVSQIEMGRWSKGRVALVGDAAACVSLLAGEGTGLALAEAYVLAGELAAAGGGHADAFRRYEERLRPFITAKQRSARRFLSSFMPRTAFGIWFRDQAIKLMALPRMGDLFLGSALRDDFALPAYGWTRDPAGAC